MKNRNKNNYSNSNKAELRIYSHIRKQYLYIRAKSRGIVLKSKGLVQFLLLKALKYDIRCDGTIRTIIALLSDENKSAVNRTLISVPNN